jgi:hypothetical protein
MSDRELVEGFFQEQLPRAISAQRDLFARTQGVLTVIVEGAGSWTIAFGDPDAEELVMDNGDPDADCVAVWTLEAFAALLRGEQAIDVIRPAAVIGDEKLLSRLGTLLLPAQKGGLGARLASLAA